MPNGDNIGVKSILVMSPIYMTSQSGALCISVTHFLGRQDFFTLVYLKALATVQGSGYSFKKTWLQSKMADLPESYTTNAHFTEVTLSMPI